jgi:hypothetical protein
MLKERGANSNSHLLWFISIGVLSYTFNHLKKQLSKIIKKVIHIQKCDTLNHFNSITGKANLHDT